jgi:NAD(P)-dependent dehydrogenase (short-subunit alcohol dehydrogenase family)
VRRVVVVGAAGDVGRGIVAEALAAGWGVTAVSRRADALADLAREIGDDGLSATAGSVATEGDALAVADAVALQADDCVVVSVHTPWRPRPLGETSSGDLAAVVSANLAPHVAAARAFLPRMGSGAVFLGVGGGMADWVPRGLVPLACAQAAIRNFYRGLEQERPGDAPAVRELLIRSMVNGRSSRYRAKPGWITDRQVGAAACAILADPAGYPGPVVTLPGADHRGADRPGGPRPATG